MAEGGVTRTAAVEGSSSATVVEDPKHGENVVLKLRPPKSDKKVQWTTGTVDNEHLNKKKSKCCCVYKKPRMFGESSDESEDDDCTNHCHGHKKKCYRHDENPEADSHDNGAAPS